MGGNGYSIGVEFNHEELMEMRASLISKAWFVLQGSKEFVLMEDVYLPPLSKSLNYGVAFFEGSKAEWVLGEGGIYTLAVPHFELNLFRLMAGIASFSEDTNLTLPQHSIEELYQGVFRLLALNIFDGPEKMEAFKDMIFYIRPVAYCVKNGVGLQVPDEWNILTMVVPVDPKYIEEDTLVVVKPAPRTMDAHTKASWKYPNHIKPKQEANRKQIILPNGTTRKGDEVLFVVKSTRENILTGIVQEGSGENVAIITKVGDRLVLTTPPATEVLPGFSMQKLEKVAEEMGMEVRRQDFTLQQLLDAELAVFTGNFAGTVAIKYVNYKDDKGVEKVHDTGAASEHPLYVELKRRYAEAQAQYRDYVHRALQEEEITALRTAKTEYLERRAKMQILLQRADPAGEFSLRQKPLIIPNGRFSLASLKDGRFQDRGLSQEQTIKRAALAAGVRETKLKVVTR